MNFNKALGMLLVHEGGFVNDSRDPGGMTNLGVTKTIWEKWVGHPVTEQDMRGLTPAIVAPLYQLKYWNSNLPDGLDYAFFDFAVNSGPGRAAKVLQSCLGVVPDGAIGPATLAAAVSQAEGLIERYSAARLAFLQGLPTWPVYKNGWSIRVADVTAAARDSA